MSDSLNSLSTATADQRARVIAALRTGPKTSYDLRRLGAYQCPTRIFELREAGYDIQTTRVNLIDLDGFRHVGIALYELVGEPGQLRFDFAVDAANDPRPPMQGSKK